MPSHPTALQGLLLAVLLATAPLAAQPVPFDLSALSPNEGVAIGPDTRPEPVNERRWRRSRPLSGFPLQFFAPEALPVGAASPGLQPGRPLTSTPGQKVTTAQPSVPPTQPVDLPFEPRNASVAAAADGVSSLAVCPNNPALARSPTTRHASICRVYVNLPNNFYGICSGAFIDANHVLLAGHCVANNGAFEIIKQDGRWGTVCCAPSSADTPWTCASNAQFNIVNVAVTGGWLGGNRNNDGALLKVARQRRTASGFGVPVRWGSIISNPCPARRPFEWDGFPATGNSQGCNVNWRGRLRYTITTQLPAPCPAANSGTLIQLVGSSCGGMSGGPLWNRVDDFVVAILVSSSISCTNGRGRVQFAQIALRRGVGGVFVQSLRNLIP